jgi:choline-glycine betaine transporter
LPTSNLSPTLPSVPCRRFAACKRSLNGTWKSTFRQNYWPTFSPTVPPFTARISRIIRTWRQLVAEIGTSKPWGGVFRVAQ